MGGTKRGETGDSCPQLAGRISSLAQQNAKSLVVQEGDRGRAMWDFSGTASHSPKQPKDMCSHKKEQGPKSFTGRRLQRIKHLRTLSQCERKERMKFYDNIDVLTWKRKRS